MKKVMAFMGVLAGLIFFLTPQCSAIFGVITSDTTWSDTVNVTGDIVIDAAASLTISSGTYVTFSADTSEWDTTDGYANRCDIIVYGTLKTLGTSSDSVTLTSTIDTAGTWGGIRFKNSSNDTIMYARLQFGTIAVYADSSDVDVSHCQISHFRGKNGLGEMGAGLVFKNSTCAVRFSTISNCSGSGGVPTYDGGVGVGIYCEGGSANLDSNVVSDCHGGGGGSDFNFGYAGGMGAGIYLQNAQSILSGNVISNCTGGRGGGGLYDGGDGGDGFGISCDHCSPELLGNSSTFCSGGDGGGGDPPGEPGVGAALFCDNANPIVKSNSFGNSEHGIYSQYSAFRIGDTLDDINDIYGNTEWNLYNGTLGSPIDATYNYWGATDEIEIANGLHGNISYSPWVSKTVDVLHYGRSFYGFMAQDTTWSVEALIRGDVVVQAGVKIGIERGTIIRFVANQSAWDHPAGTEDRCDLIVLGNLNPSGTPFDSLLFTGTRSFPGSWGTIRFLNSITPRIEYARIEYATTGIQCLNSSPDICNNTLSNISLNGILCENSSSLISGNSILSVGPSGHAYGIYCNSSSPVISGNTIRRITGSDGPNGYWAYGIYAGGPSCEIINNVIDTVIGGDAWADHVPHAGTGTGIDCSASVGSIHGNKISNCIGGGLGLGSGIGIRCRSSSPVISRNRITKCRAPSQWWTSGIFLQGSSNPVIGGSPDDQNDIHSNEDHNVRNETSNDITATYNFWGTTDPDTIALLIFDHDDNPAYGYVIYDPWAWEPLGIEEGGPVADRPFVFKLDQNNPNPFSEITSIHCSIPVESQVSLVIYDISGRRVRTLIDSRLEPGYHSIHWDGTDSSGQKVASGVYFYKLDTPTSTDTKKLSIIR